MIALQEQISGRVSRGEIRIEKHAPHNIEIHPERQKFPKCDSWAQGQINRSIVEHGFFPGAALIAHRHGRKIQLLDGWARLEAAIKAGLQDVPVVVDNSLDPFAVVLASAIAAHAHSKSRTALLLAEHYCLLHGAKERQNSGLRNQSPAKPLTTAAKIAADFNIPPAYFSNLAKVKASCTNEQWEKARQAILDGEAPSLTSVYGLIGRVTCVNEDGTKRDIPGWRDGLVSDWLDLAHRRLGYLKESSPKFRAEVAEQLVSLCTQGADRAFQEDFEKAYCQARNLEPRKAEKRK